jgi:hypothetical protein
MMTPDMELPDLDPFVLLYGSEPNPLSTDSEDVCITSQLAYPLLIAIMCLDVRDTCGTAFAPVNVVARGSCLLILAAVAISHMRLFAEL